MYFINVSSNWIIVVITLLGPVVSGRNGHSNIKIFKCCEDNFIIKSSGCVYDNSTKWTVPVYRTDHVTNDESIAVIIKYYSLHCIDYKEENFLLVFHNSSKETFLLQNDGRLWVPKVNASFNDRQFCLEYHETLGLIAGICFPGYEILGEDGDEVSHALSLIGMVISLPFLLVTFIIYALFPERNLHAKCLMCYVFSLFWVYLLPAAIYVYGKYGKFGKITIRDCKIILMFHYFLIFASFLWMNAIAVDIWLTFSGRKIISKSERKRFMRYSIYAWGMPLLPIVVAITLHNTVSSTSMYSPFAGCWFKDGYMQLLFFYGPIGILIAINMCLFMLTAWKIIQTRKQTAMLREEENRMHNSENEATGSFKIYVKLMFAMGINWSVEIVQWVIKWKVGNFPFLWYITDVCNAGFGVFIFFMFVFNKNTWKMLKKRYYMITGKADPTQTTSKLSNAETETNPARNSYG